MSKFVFLFYGQSEPTADVMAAWHEWFASIGDKIVDSGNPFGPGREVTKSGGTDLTPTWPGHRLLDRQRRQPRRGREAPGRLPEPPVRVFEAMPM